MIAATPEDAIVLVARSALSLRCVGCIGIDAVRQPVVEIHLRREFEGPSGLRRGANLNVNVHCPALIPAGVDGEKLDLAARVGDLIATEELLADGVETRIPNVRIDAQRIAMSDVHLSAWQRLTVSGAETRDRERQSQLCTGPDSPVARI